MGKQEELNQETPEYWCPTSRSGLRLVATVSLLRFCSIQPQSEGNKFLNVSMASKDLCLPSEVSQYLPTTFAEPHFSPLEIYGRVC